MKKGEPPENTGRKKAARGSDGRWRPGASGNAKGKPRGVGAVTKLRKQIADAVPEIVAVLVDAARNGDVQAARVLLDRAIPTLRAVEAPQPLALPNGTLTDQGRAVLSGVASGEVGPVSASALIGAIAALARVAEVDELMRRLEKLEQLEQLEK